MKNFFKFMWYGVKSSYKENRNLILMFLFAFGSIIISVAIGKLFTDNDLILLIIMIMSFIVSMFLCAHCIHYIEAKEYAKEHNVSFEIAWGNTKPDNEDSF